MENERELTTRLKAMPAPKTAKPRMPKTTATALHAGGGTAPTQTSFKKGKSGNPRGRPKGARHLLSESFIHSMLRFWKARGEEALEKTLQQNPAALVATIARLVPKDFQITISGDVTITHELSAEQRRKIAESWIVSQQAAKKGITIESQPEPLLIEAKITRDSDENSSNEQ